jgi:hypothetical protein
VHCAIVVQHFLDERGDLSLFLPEAVFVKSFRPYLALQDLQYRLVHAGQKLRGV